MTKRTAISLPDDLYQRIERARVRARKDRSTWLQEAASEYLQKKTRDEELEAYFRGYERAHLTDDEVSLIGWGEAHFGDTLDEPVGPRKRTRR